jgi:hypothetical protein
MTTTEEHRTLGEPFTMPVELGKVREFAVATGGDTELWTDVGTIPPTFLATARLWQGPEHTVKASGDRARLLHASQEYVFHGPPPRVGDHLTGQARVTATYEKDGKRGGLLRFTEVTTEFHDSSGRLVATAVTTTVQTTTATRGQA